MKYDPELIERLVREAVKVAAGIATGWCIGGGTRHRGECDACQDMDWLVANLRAMADQLEAARREVEHWKALAEYHCGSQNREVEPCEDGSCSHSYDSWPIGSVTKHAREVDQCDDCGWTAVQVDAYRAAKGNGGG